MVNGGYPSYFWLIAACVFLLSQCLFIFARLPECTADRAPHHYIKFWMAGKNEPKNPEENTKRSQVCTSFIVIPDFEVTPVGLVSPQTPKNAQETILFRG